MFLPECSSDVIHGDETGTHPSRSNHRVYLRLAINLQHGYLSIFGEFWWRMCLFFDFDVDLIACLH